MSVLVRDVMTADPVSLDADTPVSEAAKKMKEHDIGDVIVVDGGRVCGIVTDRDIVVRAVGEDKDPTATPLGEICSRDVTTVSPDDDLTVAGDRMRERAVRRMPVVEDGRAVGIVSIGDLAVERDPHGAIADISSAAPND